MGTKMDFDKIPKDNQKLLYDHFQEPTHADILAAEFVLLDNHRMMYSSWLN